MKKDITVEYVVDFIDLKKDYLQGLIMEKKICQDCKMMNDIKNKECWVCGYRFKSDD